MRMPLAARFVTGVDALVAVFSRSGVSEKFMRFAIVGSIGFCWDTATIYALKSFTGLYIAKTCGFLLAATANWGLNRIWTFRHQAHAAAHVQWTKFLLTNLVGFTCNGGTFFILISINSFCHNSPIYPNIVGSIVGLFFNYFLSKRFVFG